MAQSIATSGIVADAFDFLELRPLSSFADDSDEAAAAARHYPRALEIELARADYSFASTIVDLPEASGAWAVDDDLPYSFVPPTDLVRVRFVYPRGAKWRLDEGVLRSDEPGPLKIRYTRLIENEAMLPADFATAVAYNLAVRMSDKAGKSNKQKEDLRSALKDARAAALDTDRDSASPERYDGLDDPGDIVAEALR